VSIGITAYGAYLPRLRLRREAIVAANQWYAPQLKTKSKGHRSLANWDEDSITMSVAAARDLFGVQGDRSGVNELIFASTTAPFAERLNAGVVAEALNLAEAVAATDISGSQCAALAGLSQAIARVRGESGAQVLLTAADNRVARAGSAQELDYGDGAAALLLGCDNVLAEILGEASLTADFVDHFRMSGEDIDYHWEERWVREEGIGKLVPKVVAQALDTAGIAPGAVDHFIFPSCINRADASVAQSCGIQPTAVCDNMGLSVGDTGAPHGLIMLANALQTASPGQIMVVAGFGSGARAMVFRATQELRNFAPVRGVGGWLDNGIEDTSYTRLLSFKGQLELERGMRGEQDKKTALSTAWRHRRALLGLIAGRCRETGDIHFPPSRISYTPGAPAQNSQDPHPLAERGGKVMSWSAEWLSFHKSPPHQYGQIDFDGGGRVLMEFTDVFPGEVGTGMAVEMSFRIKDIDEKRGYQRYFWKAVPQRDCAAQEQGE
jgi:3-hydroxy-3-methylglutaryl CoA synthase